MRGRAIAISAPRIAELWVAITWSVYAETTLSKHSSLGLFPTPMLSQNDGA